VRDLNNPVPGLHRQHGRLRAGLLDTIDAHRCAGLAPAEAAEAAISEFGDPRLVGDACRPELAAHRAAERRERDGTRGSRPRSEAAPSHAWHAPADGPSTRRAGGPGVAVDVNRLTAGAAAIPAWAFGHGCDGPVATI
jgi:hypothetical protein